MATDLITGSDAVAESATILGSIIPTTEGASIPLVPATHRAIVVDASSGDWTGTLPDAESNGGVNFEVKRDEQDSDFFAQLLPSGTDTIDGSDKYILGNPNEYVHVRSNGTKIWRVVNTRTFAIAAIQYVDTSTTQNLTALFQKINAWNLDTFKTPGRVVSDFANNKIKVLSVQSDPQDGYEVTFNGSFQYANNVDLTFALFVDGVETQVGTLVTGKGSTTLPVGFQGIAAVLKAGGPQDIDVRVKATSDNTITYFSKMTLVVRRIGG